jgi:hypothetical protein
MWHGFGDPTLITHKNQILDQWCAEEGRDPTEIERTVGVNPRKPELGDQMIEAGCTQVTFGMGGPGYDLGPLKDWLAWRDERNAAR